MSFAKERTMVYSLREIQDDLKQLTEKQFYTKHIIRSDNWYFESYMGKSPDEVIHLIDDYRLIISESFGVSFNSVMMVGSGKLGYSMSPPAESSQCFYHLMMMKILEKFQI